jgi:general secretion pathway protein D
MLKLSIESSSIGQKPAGAVDLVTNKRTVTTNVLVDDGGVVVIGGLLQNNNQKQESRVPVLGSIPIIGLAFKTRSASTEKDNLMIFLRPKIMRDPAQSAYETDLKYNYMQDQQRGFEHREIPPLLPGERQPRLPPLPPPPPNQPPQSPEEQARQSEAKRAAEDAAEHQREKAKQEQAAPQPQAAPPPANPTAPPPQDGGKR